MKRIPNKFRNQPMYRLTKEATIRWLNGDTYAAIAESHGTSIAKVRTRIASFLESIQTAMRSTDVMMVPEQRFPMECPFMEGRDAHTLRSKKDLLISYIEILEGEQYMDRGSMALPHWTRRFALEAVDTCPACTMEFRPSAFTKERSLCPICNKGLLQLKAILEADHAN